MTLRPAGCLAGGCAFALALLVAVPLYRMLATSAEARRQAVLLVVLGLLLVLLALFGGRLPQPGTWKCAECGENNPEDKSACAGCGKDRA
jgi:hypothetical protein